MVPQKPIISNWLLIILIIIALFGGIFLGWKYLKEKSVYNSIQNPPSNSSQINKNYAQGEIIVGFKEGVGLDEGTQLVESFSLKVKNKHEVLNFLLVEVPAGKESVWMKKFQEQSIVKYVELNYFADTQ